MKKIWNFLYKYRYWIFIVILFIFFFLQMQNVLLYDDDFDVKYPIYLDQSLGNKINWIISKMNFFWFEWSGRIIGHFIVTSGLTLFGLNFYSFLNPIVIFLLAFVSSKILCLMNKKIVFEKVLFFFSLIFIGMNLALSREILYWSYGGILYVWGFLLVLTIFYKLFKYYEMNTEISRKSFILLIILIIIQAFILEQLCMLVIGFISIFLLFNFIKNKKINYKGLILLIISICCFFISYSAPGNFARVDNLVSKVNGLNTIDVIISKIFSLLQFLFDKRFCGLYLLFLSFIVSFKYLKNSLKRKYYLIPVIIIFIGNTLLILNNYLNFFPYFNLYDNYNSLDFAINNNIYNFYMVLGCIIYLIIYLISLLFCLIKTINKNNVKLVIFWFISLISIIVPIICLEFIGTRYCLPFLVLTIIMILYYLSECEKNISSIIMLIILPLIVPINLSIICFIVFEIAIFILYFIIKKYNCDKVYYALIFIYGLLLCFNLINAYINYSYNKSISDYNDNILLNVVDNNATIELKEIKKKTANYAWNTFFSNYTDYGVYYTYLNKFVKQYYGINPDKIYFIN